MIRHPLRLSALAEILYPRQCIECGGGTDECYRYICWTCASLITWLRAPMCAGCGEPVDGRVDSEFLCHLCLQAPRHFDLARSVTRFDGVVREAIHQFKYQRGIWMVDDLTRLLEAGWSTYYPNEATDLICCVPLHLTRRRTRGFNQSELLAGALAHRLGIPARFGCIRRIRATETQTRLAAPQRVANVRGAFACPNPSLIRDKSIVLVDDVMTTGATVSEVSRCLKSAGASRVLVLTVSRG